jgi:hypothetical protein
MNFTNEQIRMLAEVDRDMDSGKQPFVRDSKGFRFAFPSEVMQQCGVESGQTACESVIIALMQANLAMAQSRILLEKVSGR